ncbi:F0F1 ATP synthase subunit A [Enterococcus faecium]|nr:F0F1 ATP synthase subunit A [Enterococcus faecium]
MDERSLTFHIGPIWFDGTVCIMVLLTCLIVFFLAYFFTRNLKLKPTGKQNAIEWVIDFSRGIVTDNLPRKELSNFHLLAFYIVFICFCCKQHRFSNKIVLPNETTLWKSPTADPFVTLTLAFIMILLTHLFGVKS